MAGKSREKEPLRLDPKLRVKRLNRLAVLLVALLGILVLWVAYFVLSSQGPIAPPGTSVTPSLHSAERLALERLEREALENPEPLRTRRREVLAPQTPPRAVRTDPEVVQARQKLRRAYEAQVLVPGFSLEAGRQLPRREQEMQVVQVPVESGGELGDSPESFLRRAREERPSGAIPATLVEPVSSYELKAGTLLPATLTAGIHSDLPGLTQALVRRDVYDSVTGRHLLVPQGARLLGRYDHRIVWGQKRVLVAWQRLVFPDGRSLDLEGLPGVDLAARAGLRDKSRQHLWSTLGQALMLSAISAGAQLSQPQEAARGEAPSARQVAAAALGQEVGRTAAEVTRRQLDRQPSLEIRPGYLFHVEVTGDLVFPGPYREKRR